MLHNIWCQVSQLTICRDLDTSMKHYIYYIHGFSSELENLTENANTHDLFHQSRGIWVLKHQRITVDKENVNENLVTIIEFTHVSENPVTTFTLGEDMIIIRYIVSLHHPDNKEIRYSAQIIWNSIFS